MVPPYRWRDARAALPRWVCVGALSMSASFAACTGAIEPAPGGRPTDTGTGNGGSGVGPTGGGGTGSTTGGTMGTGGQTGGGTATNCNSGQVRVGAAVIRRLNKFEYNNTVRDLVNDTSNMALDFPAEEQVHGFNNNGAALTVPTKLAEDYLSAAERLASDAVEKSMTLLAPSPACDLTKEDAACVQRFIEQFGERAYRGPLASDEITVLKDVYAAGKTSGGHKNGLKLAIATMLVSPRFLYRAEFGVPAATGETLVRLDSWEMATRLSYLLWGTMPDAALITAAKAGQLVTDEQIAAQVDRMTKDTTRSRLIVHNFHEQWLELEKLSVRGGDKDAKTYPSWNASLVPMMAEETQRFIDYVIFESQGTVEELFTAPYTFLNATLAKHYDPRSTTTSTTMTKVALDGAKRGGLLTQGSLMTILANADQSSPVRRGAFVRENILCDQLLPPPDDVKIDLPVLDPKLTTRERFSEHRKNMACAGCHTFMDPIGLGFENFDGVGRWRDTENGLALDVTGEVVGMPDGKFNGPMDLARKLGASEKVASCVVRKWFTYGYGRAPSETDDSCSLDLLKREFASSGYNVRGLIAGLTKTPAFRYRRAGGAQ